MPFLGPQVTGLPPVTEVQQQPSAWAWGGGHRGAALPRPRSPARGAHPAGAQRYRAERNGTRAGWCARSTHALAPGPEGTGVGPSGKET